MSKRKHYDKEFKVQAVKLALEIGQSKACNELNLPENTIYGWMHAYRQGKLDLMRLALKQRLPEGVSIPCENTLQKIMNATGIGHTKSISPMDSQRRIEMRVNQKTWLNVISQPKALR